MMRNGRSVAMLYLLVAALVATSCGGPSDDEVKQAFLREHPRAEVTDVYVSEGDSDHAYFTIKYREGGEAHIGCWSYYRDEHDRWQVRAKSSVSERLKPQGYCR